VGDDPRAVSSDVDPIWAVVAGRMGSSRAPGKTMAPLAGRPSLWHIVHRLRRVPELDGVVIATTERPEDDPIRELTRDLDVACYSGSVDDVLGRTLAAAKSVGARTIVQVTGDCPLVDGEIVAEAVAAYAAEGADYVSNRLYGYTYPDGYDVEVFGVSLLEEVDAATQEPYDREHVTPYVYAHPERYRLFGVEATGRRRRPDLHLSLDTAEDVAVIQEIYEALWKPERDFGIEDVLDLLDSRADLAAAAAMPEMA
jgi:spore coat polysaccharide biosynthesis protein SpsF